MQRARGICLFNNPWGRWFWPHPTHSESRTLPAPLCKGQQSRVGGEQHILGAQPVQRGISRDMRHCQDLSHALALARVVADCVSESYINKHPDGRGCDGSENSI